MHTITTCVTLAIILSLGGVASAAEVTVVRGGAALATFHQTSSDGCLLIDGEIVVVEARRGGGLANGLYVTGTRVDVCAGDNGNGYAGFAEGSFDVVGLARGYFAGPAVVESYSGGPPLTFELDLSWLGQGAVTQTHDVFRDGDIIEFSFTATRDARTVGGFTIDGEEAEVTAAWLLAGTSGRIVR
jgi:hypothetical protein